MKEVHEDFWDIKSVDDIDVDALCCTTNGVLDRNKALIMGKGIALDFKEQFPFLPSLWGGKVLSNGNHSYFHFDENRKIYIISFPTKYNWRDKSNLNLIKQSCEEIIQIADDKNLSCVLLTRPGCGNGGLSWEYEVEPVISKILDDRFVVVYK